MKAAWRFITTPRFSYLDQVAIYLVAAILGVVVFR